MYTVSKAVRTTHGQDGAVVLDIQRGRVLRLNATASFILEHLQRGEPELQIIEEFCEYFCISREVGQPDIDECLISMEQVGLVHNDATEMLP
jgi:hypothetical protein